MLSIAIYSDNPDTVRSLKDIIKEFLIEMKIVAKASEFNDPIKFITAPGSFDIYIMDMDSKEDCIKLGEDMMNIDVGSHFIYISADKTNAYYATKIQADYFLQSPVDKAELTKVLKSIKKDIQFDSIIIKIPEGEKRIRANNLNYINIVSRCLCYHLRDGAILDGQTLRTSFEKAIYPLQEHKSKIFYFLSPSLLINLGGVREIHNDKLVFENDEVLYVPKKAIPEIKTAWMSYTRIVN